jgi:cell wall assembly regulator SMI1
MKILKLIKKIDKWISDALYDLYPNLTKHMKK